MKAILSLAALAASASADKSQARDSAVNKVIDLLVELKGKVEADLKAEEVLMEEYTTWCDDEQTKTSYAIKDEKRRISELQAIIEDSSAKVEQFSSQLAELGPAIAGKEQEKKQSEDVRAKENADFLAEEKELVEAEDMLRRAHGVLKRSLSSGLSFAQGGENKMKEVVDALGAIINASWMDPEKAAKIKAFMDTSDDLVLRQPQATVSSYESKSGGILETIDNMRDQVVENLRKARNAETSSKHAFELFVQSVSNEITTLNSELSSAQANKGSSAEAEGAASTELKTVQESLAADEAYLAGCTSDCNLKAEEWTARQASAQEELRTLDEAKEVLASKVSVLAQTQVSLRRVHGDEAFDKRDRVVQILKKLGRKYNSFGLLQASTKASADPFGKIRGMIVDMIAKLEQQAREEADHDEMCRTEISTNTKKKQKKIAELEKYQTRLDGAVARSGALKGEIATLVQEVKDLDSAVATATKLRNEENAANTKTVDDNKASAAAVAEAIKILREFYGDAGKAALFQVAPPSFQAAKSDATHSIIGILETAESDFTKLFMETETSESEAAASYKTFMQEAEVTKAKKQTSIAGKQQEIETLGVQQSQLKDDLQNTNSELEAVITTLTTLQKQCENKAMSYEDRKSRREAEIAGLQEALEILSADDSAALLQRAKKSFLKKN